MKRTARRVGIAALGGTVLVIGIAMIPLPGPSSLVIPLGLAILALEFDWARKWLVKFRTMLAAFRRKVASKLR